MSKRSRTGNSPTRNATAEAALDAQLFAQLFAQLLLLLLLLPLYTHAESIPQQRGVHARPRNRIPFDRE